MARRVFYSFHYQPDAMRAAQVRNIGAIEGNQPVGPNEWEEVKRGGDAAIERWIDSEMYHKSCVVVLIGQHTAGRKWITYEINKGWSDRKGVVGIYINKLSCPNQGQCPQGPNPFDTLEFDGRRFSSVVKAYNPPYVFSKDVYRYIGDNLAAWVDEAVMIRDQY